MFTFKQLMNWKRYEEVRIGGQWNMFDPLARSETTLTKDEWSFCMNNYTELKAAAVDLNHDIFLRADSFSDETWYNEFRMYLAIGVCQVAQEDAETVQIALYRMGHETRQSLHDGMLYIMPQTAS